MLTTAAFLILATAPDTVAPRATAPVIAAKQKIVVLDVVVDDVEKNIVSPLTEVLSTEIARTGRFDVVTGRDLASLLGYQAEKQRMNCDDVSCFAELGGSMGARLIVASAVGKVGDMYVVNVKLIDTKNVQVEQRVYEKVEGRVEVLLDTFKKIVPRLFSSVPFADEASEGGPSMWRSPRTWAYTTLIAGAALAIFGGVSTGMAVHAVADKPQWTIDDANSSRMWAGLMYTGYGAGAALLITGASLWLISGHSAAPVAATIVPTENGLALSLGGRW